MFRYSCANRHTLLVQPSQVVRQKFDCPKCDKHVTLRPARRPSLLTGHIASSIYLMILLCVVLFVVSQKFDTNELVIATGVFTALAAFETSRIASTWQLGDLPYRLARRKRIGLSFGGIRLLTFFFSTTIFMLATAENFSPTEVATLIILGVVCGIWEMTKTALLKGVSPLVSSVATSLVTTAVIGALSLCGTMLDGVSKDLAKSVTRASEQIRAEINPIDHFIKGLFNIQTAPNADEGGEQPV